ncbi:phosphatidylglycerophosphatase A [Poseidonocella pacifica]|uniref:Phosphatidylglycerophosphatase A n=1 Tax=Poseidonocella pacifica TaxID=871651 RepID=A0A1I0WK36_9RHOB|nr:phosphatidylglycerophosphatase A [Poseidonocella pacifica]SFA88757.1 phosphatidylglycerophosphatase A [Poseidonocella pacifica]
MTRLIALWFGVGLLRPAPGTWGSLAALPFAWVLHTIGGFPLLALCTFLLLAIGWWAVREETRGAADEDPSEIVVDEVVGQWLALWTVSWGAWHVGMPVLALWPGVISAFVLFRAFDIWKPGPVGWADRKGGPFGVMLDDVIAGVFAAVGTLLLGAFYHVVLM